jgi:hypothetical protein
VTLGPTNGDCLRAGGRVVCTGKPQGTGSIAQTGARKKGSAPSAVSSSAARGVRLGSIFGTIGVVGQGVGRVLAHRRAKENELSLYRVDS